MSSKTARLRRRVEASKRRRGKPSSEENNLILFSDFHDGEEVDISETEAIDRSVVIKHAFCMRTDCHRPVTHLVVSDHSYGPFDFNGLRGVFNSEEKYGLLVLPTWAHHRCAAGYSFAAIAAWEAYRVALKAACSCGSSVGEPCRQKTTPKAAKELGLYFYKLWPHDMRNDWGMYEAVEYQGKPRHP